MTCVTRFAPSPSGLLHAGHAYSALCAHKYAQQAGGRFLLRIEDIDSTRCRAEYEQAIFDDLRWLGLSWEMPVRRQSEHFDAYARTREKLVAMGVLYRSFLTRRQIREDIARAPHGRAPVYHGPKTPLSADEEAQRLQNGEAFAWRLSLRAARRVLGARWDDLHFIEEGRGPAGEHGRISARPALLGDVVLARKDIATSYHLAVTHDDAAQGITHVVRGQDLFESTHIHVLLQALLGLPTPVYHHHRLITDAQGKRLATRDSARTLDDWRKSGASVQDLRQSLGL